MSTATFTRANITVFAAHTVLIQAITFVLRPAAVYRALELDVPGHWLGALGASFALVPLLLAIPAGQLSDRFGEKRVMLAGAVFTLLAAAVFTLAANDVAGIVAASVLLGTGHLFSVVGQQALVANHTPPTRYDRAFGHYTFAASLGQALGPALIIAFGGRATIPETGRIFEWSLALALALIALTIALPANARRSRKAAKATGSIGTLLRTRGLIPALSVSCVVLAAVDITLVYLPAIGADRGISSGVVGLLLATRAVSSMASRFFLGHLSGLIGRRRLMVTSVLISAAGVAALALPLPVWTAFPIVIVLGLGLGAGQPLTMSWLAEATPPGLRGRAMSLRLTGNRLGQIVIPTVAGLVAIGSGPAAVLWVMSGCLFAVSAAARTVRSPAQPSLIPEKERHLP